jgi:hypothetical protein
MMRADLANMMLGVNLLDALNIELGFDLGSVVREVSLTHGRSKGAKGADMAKCHYQA